MSHTRILAYQADRSALPSRTSRHARRQPRHARRRPAMPGQVTGSSAQPAHHPAGTYGPRQVPVRGHVALPGRGARGRRRQRARHRPGRRVGARVAGQPLVRRDRDTRPAAARSRTGPDRADRVAGGRAAAACERPAQIYVRTTPASVAAVQGVLPASADPAAPQDTSVSNPTDALTARADASAAFQGLFLGLGAVALLVGGIGIANVMVIAVLESGGRSDCAARSAPAGGTSPYSSLPRPPCSRGPAGLPEHF